MNSQNFIEKFNALDDEAKEVIIKLIDLLTRANEVRDLYDFSNIDERLKAIAEKHNTE